MAGALLQWMARSSLGMRREVWAVKAGQISSGRHDGYNLRGIFFCFPPFSLYSQRTKPENQTLPILLAPEAAVKLFA